jgi:hypothetical protein
MTYKALVLTLVLCGVERASADVPLQPGAAVRFASVEEGGRLLTTRDAFVAALSPFDRSVRLMTDRDVSEDEYLRHVAGQVRAWQRGEVDKLSGIVASLRGRLAPWNLLLPDRVLLVKTTGREEGSAAYTRANAVVLPQRYVDQPAASLEETLLHELFHVLSRHNPGLREAIYGVIGFQPRGRIELPKSLAARKITNPDSVGVDYAIRVTRAGETFNAVPVLYSSSQRPVAGRPLFAYLTFRLMAIEQRGNAWAPKLVGGRPLLFEHTEVGGFFEQVGRNTGYLIHPEEILADNFVLLVTGKRDVPTPRILEHMARVLREK